MNRKLRLAALALTAASAVGVSAGTAHALVYVPGGPTVTLPPVHLDPCLINPDLCVPPPEVTTTTTMPTTSTTGANPTTTTVPTPTHPTGDPVPPAPHAPVVHASPNFTG